MGMDAGYSGAARRHITLLGETDFELLPQFFGNWEDFLRAACQLEFILELNSYLGVGEAGQKPKEWLARYRPDTIFNYVPDHLRYELSVCRPIAEELYEAIKRSPDHWPTVFLSIQKTPF